MRASGLFGGLVAEGIGFTFALKVLPIIIFFASLIAVLYHIGIRSGSSGSLEVRFKVLGTSRESMSATANILWAKQSASW